MAKIIGFDKTVADKSEQEKRAKQRSASYAKASEHIDVSHYIRGRDRDGRN